MQIIILSVTGILLVSCENNVQLIEDKLRSELNEEQQKSAGDWERSPQGTWIRHFQIEKSWTDARSHCLSLGPRTDLITILSKEQGDWMIKHANCTDCANFAWTGAIDYNRDGEFKWASNNETVSIADWDVVYYMEENSGRRANPSEASEVGENDGDFQDCIIIFGDDNAKYSDYSCTEKFFFFCEKM